MDVARSQFAGRHRGAYTLVEVALASAVASLILLGSAGAVAVAAKSLPTSSSAGKGAAPSTATLAIAEEIGFAVAVTSRSSRVLEFRVASRTGGAEPDTIRYEWSGTPGDPLMRTVNPGAGGVAEAVLKDVKALSFAYDLRTVESSEEQIKVTESNELLFARFDGWAGVTSPNMGNYTIGTIRWFAQHFALSEVTFPNTTTKVRITRVRVRLRKGSGMGNFTVAVHRTTAAGSPEPAAAPVGGAVQGETAILPAAYAWSDFAMPADVAFSTPPQELVIVIKGLADSAMDASRYYSTSAPANTSTFIWSIEGGASWNPSLSQRHHYDAPFEVYGTYETTEPQVVQKSTYFLRSVDVRVSAGAKGSAMAATVVRVHNQPEVPAP